MPNVNKVVYGNNTLVDLTGDDITPNDVLNSKKFHDASGALRTGSADISGKADKVQNATADNFAALDANGNLKDSGHKHSDYLTQHQDISGKMNTDGSNAASHVSFVNSAFTIGTRASGQTVGNKSFAQGNNVTASGNYSHAEGYNSSSYEIIASGTGSHAEGYVTGNTGRGISSSGKGSHAEGSGTTASGDYSHAEGMRTTASSDCAHAEGLDTTASVSASHAEGRKTTASGFASHAEGENTTASSAATHAGGFYTEAKRFASFAHGNCDDSYKKFRDTAMAYNGDACFGFDMSVEDFSANTDVTDSQNGCCGTIRNVSTVTLSIAPQGIYYLVYSGYQISTGAVSGYGSRLIHGHGIESGTPVINSLASAGSTTTIAAAANNKITVKNGNAQYASQFSLIRLF